MANLGSKTLVTDRLVTDRYLVTRSGDTESKEIEPVVLLGSIANQQTDNYTLALTDIFKTVEMSKATALDLTVPLNSVIAFPIGTIIYVKRTGVGVLTLVATGGVTITGSSGALTDAGLNVVMSLIKTGTDTWDLQNGAQLSINTYTPSVTGWTGGVGATGYYFLIGKMCMLSIIVSGISNSTTATATLPFNTATSHGFAVRSVHYNAGLPVDGRSDAPSNSNLVTFYSTVGGGGWTGSGNKICQLFITFEIA